MNHLVASLDCLTALIRRTRKEDISFGLPITQLHNHTLESFSKNKLFSYLDIPAMNISDCLNEYQLQMASSFGVDYVTFDFCKAGEYLVRHGFQTDGVQKDVSVLDALNSSVLTSLERGRNYIDRNNLPTKIISEGFARFEKKGEFNVIVNVQDVWKHGSHISSVDVDLWKFLNEESFHEMTDRNIDSFNKKF